jgi:hypothetical protein
MMASLLTGVTRNRCGPGWAVPLGESSRSERPVKVRNTSSSVGLDKLMDCSVTPAL